jgi:hypothetical protein
MATLANRGFSALAARFAWLGLITDECCKATIREHVAAATEDRDVFGFVVEAIPVYVVSFCG